MNQYMQYVNSTMDEINSLCAELYEALADKERKEVKEIVKKIVRSLRDIQISTDE